MTAILRQAEADKKIGFEDLKGIIKNIAFYDKRALNIKDLMIDILKKDGTIQPETVQALELLARWDNLQTDADGNGFCDQPGAAIFDSWWQKVIPATFEDEFAGYKNVFGQTAVQILSNRYHGYTLFMKALQGKTPDRFL